MKALTGDDDVCDPGIVGIVILVVVIVLVFLIALIFFIPMHYWIFGGGGGCGRCCSCFLGDILLDQDPARQYGTLELDFQQQHQQQQQSGNNPTTRTDDSETINLPCDNGTFTGTSRLTLVTNLCCCLTKGTLELAFDVDGTVSGTKRLENVNSETTILGRWIDQKFLWLETSPAGKAVVSGRIVSKTNTTILKGNYYASKGNFGKFFYQCPNPKSAISSNL